MFGATPFNTIAQVRAQFVEKDIAVQMVTAVNLPMLMKTLAMRQGMILAEFISAIVNSGKEAIQDLEISAME